MTEPERPADSTFVRIARELLAARSNAPTPADKDAATEELAHMLRMAGDGHLDTYIASRPQFADEDW